MILEQLKDEKKRVTSLPQLPERALFVGTEETPNNLYVTVTAWMPKMEHPFLYAEHAYMVPVPTISYRVKWHAQSKRVVAFQLAITTDEVVTPDSPLYRWPWSNVYNDGKVCWTQSWKSELKDVERNGVYAFIGTPNNTDLWGLGRSHNGPKMSYAEFLAETEKGINPDWLIPLNKTVAEFHAQA